MSRFTKHITLPLLASLAVVALYLTPVTVIECRTRGLLALAVVLVSFAFGIAFGVRGIRARLRGEAGSGWWIASMCVLALPALLVLGPLG